MKKMDGFSLMELMIVVAIIGILVLLAIPSYQRYTRRAHFAEVIQAAAPYKIGVEECYQMTGELTSCRAGQQGVPPALEKGAGLVDQISVSSQGVIKVVPHAKYGISKKDVYVLTPTIQKNILSWKSSGRAVTEGYAN